MILLFVVIFVTILMFSKAGALLFFLFFPNFLSLYYYIYIYIYSIFILYSYIFDFLVII